MWYLNKLDMKDDEEEQDMGQLLAERIHQIDLTRKRNWNQGSRQGRMQPQNSRHMEDPPSESAGPESSMSQTGSVQTAVQTAASAATRPTPPKTVHWSDESAPPRPPQRSSVLLLIVVFAIAMAIGILLGHRIHHRF
jgi:hypothetical protein